MLMCVIRRNTLRVEFMFFSETDCSDLIPACSGEQARANTDGLRSARCSSQTKVRRRRAVPAWGARLG